MKIKICGMRDPENMKEVIRLIPDFIGFIFYPKSRRFVGHDFPPINTQLVPDDIKKVGVFVNESIEQVLKKAEKYLLDFVQLHGGESPDYCQELKSRGIRIIKVFSIEDSFNVETIQSYLKAADLFLFDTKTAGYGGSGKKFNWDMLESLVIHKPFLLSGGIGPEDDEHVKKIDHPDFAGVDVNSRFELEPGLKNSELLQSFMQKINE